MCRMKEWMSEPLQGPGLLLPELACPRLDPCSPSSLSPAFVPWSLAALATCSHFEEPQSPSEHWW